MGLTGQEKPSEEEGLLQRVKRLERICLILLIDVIFLWIVLLRLTGSAERLVGIFRLIMEQLNLIG